MVYFVSQKICGQAARTLVC